LCIFVNLAYVYLYIYVDIELIRFTDPETYIKYIFGKLFVG